MSWATRRRPAWVLRRRAVPMARLPRRGPSPPSLHQVGPLRRTGGRTRHHSLCSSRSSILFHSNRVVLLDCNGSSQQRDVSPAADIPPPQRASPVHPPLLLPIERRSPWTPPLVAPLRRFEGTSAACSSPSTRGLRRPCFSPSHVTHGRRHLPLHGVAPTRPSPCLHRFGPPVGLHPR